jgi:hypothetical protein
MYIRRKVFSQTQDWDYGYEMEERLYSTGDYELDEILERAFCEGYEAAQREFASYVLMDDGTARSGAISNHASKSDWEKMLKDEKAAKGKIVGATHPSYDPVSGGKSVIRKGDDVWQHTVDRNGKGYSTKHKFEGKNSKQLLTKTTSKEKMRRIGDWVKAHPGKAAAIVAGTAAVGAGAGYAIKKARED